MSGECSATKQNQLKTDLECNGLVQFGCPLDFSKNFLLRKTAANFTGISRKRVFSVSKRKIIENRVKNKNLKQIFPKILQFSISNFNLHN